MSSKEIEIPLKPITRTDIHRLEIALMLGTLLRPDVIEKIKNPEERLTWIDSLGVAAAALARSSAGMPVSRIAEELGRSEGTIRRHLAGKTEAGRLVKETYEKFAREGVKIELPSELMTAKPVKHIETPEEIKKKIEEEFKKKEEEYKKKMEEEKKRAEEIQKKLEEQIKLLRQKLEEEKKKKEALEKAIEKIKEIILSMGKVVSK